MNITKEEFEAILAEATEAGRLATVGMKDTYPCGGAYLTVGGNDFFFKFFKKYAEKTVSNDYELGDWRMWKSSPGFVVSNKKNGGYQNMDMHSAENNAYVRVFGMNNMAVGVRTYID